MVRTFTARDIVASDVGIVQMRDWDASELTGLAGAGVECRVFQSRGAKGKPSGRRGVEVGAVEWITATG